MEGTTDPAIQRLKRKQLLQQLKKQKAEGEYPSSSSSRSDTALPSSTSPVKTAIKTTSNNNLKQQTTPTPTQQPSQQSNTFQPKDRISSEEEVSETEEHRLRKRQRKLYPENETDEKYKFAPVILDRYQVSSDLISKAAKQEQKEYKKKSFRDVLLGENADKLKPIVSPYTLRTLKPFIWRDFDARPLKMKLLEQIVAFAHLEDKDWIPEQHPIDYCYLRRAHLQQVNELLCTNFWVGIDVSECLQYPDFTVVALYKHKVVGCAFMTPDGYITYIVVHPEWRGAGIGTFMLYHLVQTITDKDITLHVSVTNSAMILYQKFGFKPEEFIINFYHKYYPPDAKECLNAFFLRLRR